MKKKNLTIEIPKSKYEIEKIIEKPQIKSIKPLKPMKPKQVNFTDIKI